MESYYFTFGCGHPLGGFVQRVFASNEPKARETMHRFYGDRWAFGYGPDAHPVLDLETGIVDLGGYKYRKLDKDLTEGETLW